MIGTLAIEITAHSPQKPLCPIFSFRNSPSSIRLTGIPKSVGSWNITRVYVIATSPDNSTQEIDCVRTGNVWVGTFNGCETAGKVLQGVSIMADGVDENNQPVEGYCLGKSDYYVMDAQSDIKALVEKYEVRYLQDLPTNPSIGDMYLANGTMKFFTGSEWVDFGGGSTEGLVTEEEFNEFKEGVTASLSVIDSSLSILSASASTMGESISAISASISTMTSSISTMTSSISALTSTKRNYTDLSWKYTRTTDPVMYGVKKFHVVKDEDGQQSHSYDLMDFDETTKVWSEYEAPVSIKAYGPNLYAVIDEDNPHTFEYDDVEYSGWEFFRVNDSATQFTVSGGGENIEYHINLTRRADDTFAMESEVNEKRNKSDLTWDYPMDADKDMFGVGYFVVDTGHQTYLREFSNVIDGDDNVWKTWGSIETNGWKIDTLDGRHYNLYQVQSGTSTKVGEFTRTSDTNLRWDVAIGSSNEVLVMAYRREPGTLAVYQPNVNDATQRYLMFGQSSSSAGVVICDDVSAKANSFIKVDDMMITGPNYTSSRGVQMRGVRDVDNHLKVNGSAIAFVNEVEAVSADVSTMASSVSTLDSSVSALISSVSALASSMATKRDFFDLVYPNFNDNINDGFGMMFGYSFEGGLGSLLPFNGTDGINGETCATWGWHGQILVAMPNQSTIWLLDKYDNIKHTIFLNEFKKANWWLDYVSPAQDDMIIDATGESRIVYLYLGTTFDGRDKNTKIVLENQLSVYATTSALDVVSASVSAMASSITSLESGFSNVTASVSTMASSIGGLESAISTMDSTLSTMAGSMSDMSSSISTLNGNVQTLTSTVSAMASSMNGKRDYLDLTYSYSSTSTVTQSIFDPLYKTSDGSEWYYNKGDENNKPWGITAMTITFPSNIMALMEQLRVDYDAPLPEGYSELPSTYDLDWVEDEEWEVQGWMPTGQIVLPEASTWKDYFTNYLAGECFKITLSGVVSSTEQWLNGPLELITGMNWGIDGYLGFKAYLFGNITINGVRSEMKEWEDGYQVHASNFYNISAEPTNVTVTWIDDTTGDSASGTATVTPIMPTSTSTVVVSDSLALQGAVTAVTASVSTMANNMSAMASSVAANTSAISTMASSLNVSGIGCSTVTMSGIFASDSTSFAYNFVIQPSA